MASSVRKDIEDYWSYCSPFLQQALIRKYREHQLESSAQTTWHTFLAEEFGLGRQSNTETQEDRNE